MREFWLAINLMLLMSWIFIILEVTGPTFPMLLALAISTYAVVYMIIQLIRYP